MITRRNLLKTLGLGVITLATETLADIFLSKQITRTNDIKEATVFEVTPVKIPLVDNVTLSGIRFITPDHHEKTYGVFEHNRQLYFVEDPAKKLVKRNGVIILQPYKSQITSLDNIRKSGGLEVPIEVTSNEIIKPVEIKPTQSKIEGYKNTLPSFSINSETYCIARSSDSVYHLIKHPSRGIGDGKDTFIAGSSSVWLGNLETKVK